MVLQKILDIRIDQMFLFISKISTKAFDTSKRLGTEILGTSR